MTQNKTDMKQDIKNDTAADTGAAVQPLFILDNRDLLHLAVARPHPFRPIVFMLMCPKENLLKTFVEQKTFKDNTDCDNYVEAVQGMVAANYAMRPKIMDVMEDEIKRFNDAMKKMTDETGFWNNPHTR